MEEKFCLFIFNVICSGITASIISGLFENSRRKKQNKNQVAKECLPVFLQLLEDLEILEYAFIHNGCFCPLIEHRCPSLSNDDGDGLRMSYAQRGHQFLMVGRRIIKNCRQLYFLIPQEYMLKTLPTCLKIENFLCQKQSRNSKSHLDLMITRLISSLVRQDASANSEQREFAERLHQFHNDLETNIQEELPKFNK